MADAEVDMGKSPEQTTQPDQNTSEPPKLTRVERAEFFLGELDKKCKAEQIKIAVVLIVDPKLENPIIYTLGDKIEQALAGCDLARVLKGRLIDSPELTV